MKNLTALYPNLLLKIADLNISEQFKLMTNLNGFVTLEDLVNGNLDHLPELPGSSMHVVKEAIQLLKQLGLLELAED